MGGWGELFASLHRSLLGVVRAELEELVGSLALSGRRLRGAFLLLLFAAGLFLLLVAALAFTLVAALMLFLPAWGAGLVIAGALALACALAAWLGKRRLRGVESPAASVRRRVDEHLAWWRGRVVPGGEIESDAGEIEEGELEDAR